MPFLLRFQNKYPPNPTQGGNSFSAKSSVLSITDNLFIGKFFSGNHLIFRLRPYYKNWNKRILKSPKLNFYDTGLFSYLLRIENPKQIAQHPLAST